MCKFFGGVCATLVGGSILWAVLSLARDVQATRTQWLGKHVNFKQNPNWAPGFVRNLRGSDAAIVSYTTADGALCEREWFIWELEVVK